MSQKTRASGIVRAVLIAAVALTVRFGFWSEIRGTPLDAWHLWDQTDMATYLTQAHRIVDGDWLGKQPYHPYNAWQTSAGTEEDWLRWYGPGAFHQAPLYSYALAAAMMTTGRFVGLVKILQILLGVATCVTIAGIARSIDGDTAGWIAGLIAAMYGPLLYLEPQLLREGPALFGFALLLYLLTRQSARFVPAVAGVLLGVYAMFYETWSVLAAVTALILTVRLARRSRRAAVWGAVALACGWLVGFAPLFVRNVAVGSPPLATSSRLAVNLAYANMPSAARGGMFFTPPGPELARIMDSSGGTAAGVLAELARLYAGDPIRLARNLGLRFLALCGDVELPDNTSFAFYRGEAPLLRASLDFGWIFAPGAAAIAVLLGLGAWRPVTRAQRAVDDGPSILERCWIEHRRAHGSILVFLPALLAALVAVHPQARYRLFLVPILIVYAALFVVLAARALRERAWRTLAAEALVAVVLIAAQKVVSVPLRPVAERPVDYAAAAHLGLEAGQRELAIRYYRHGIALHAAEVGLRVELAQALVAAGRAGEAIEQMEAAAALRPDDPELQRLLRALREMPSGASSGLPPG